MYVQDIVQDVSTEFNQDFSKTTWVMAKVVTFLAVNYRATIKPVFFVKHLYIISSYGAKIHVSSLFQLTAN